MIRRSCLFVLVVLITLAFIPDQEKLTKGGVKPGEDVIMEDYGNDPNTLNPITSNDTTSGSFMRWVVDSLADRKIDNPEEFDPILAEKWEFDEKNLEYTIHLRKGVMWHPAKFPDGTPIPSREFTSDDVKFTFDVILNRNVNAASIRSYYEDPDAKSEAERYKIRITVIDKYTIKVKWTQPYFLAQEFTLGIGIIPKHVYSVDEKGEPISLDISSTEFAEGFNNHWFNSSLCGTGPMMFKEWKKNERLELVRNPNYWDKPFYFSKIIIRNIPNPNTSLQMLLNGELDYSGIGEKIHYVQSKEAKNVKAGKVTLVDFDATSYRYIGYNQRRDIFKDPKVRWAMGYAIPVQKIIDKVLYGLATRLSGPFIPGSTSYDSSLELIPYDPAKAMKILDEAGWKDTNDNGIRDKKINTTLVELKFDLMIYGDSPMYKTIAEIIKEECRQVGIDIQISPVKWALMLDKIRKKDFDACMLGWALSWKQDPFQIFHGSQADVPESSNAIGYRNPELDKLIETLRVTFDPKKQIDLYHQIHKMIYDDQPYTFLFSDKATLGYDARLQNLKFYKIRPYTDAREWYAAPDRARQ